MSDHLEIRLVKHQIDVSASSQAPFPEHLFDVFWLSPFKLPEHIGFNLLEKQERIVFWYASSKDNLRTFGLLFVRYEDFGVVSILLQQRGHKKLEAVY